MDAFISFIQQYWQILLSSFTALLSVIIFLLKKKPQSNLLDVVFCEVLSCLPNIINSVEEPGNGSFKKTNVIEISLNLFSHILGRSLTSDEFKKYSLKISDYIENVLSTPQKKGEKQDVQS